MAPTGNYFCDKVPKTYSTQALTVKKLVYDLYKCFP